jgi:YVTN family beta-propeller protein
MCSRVVIEHRTVVSILACLLTLSGCTETVTRVVIPTGVDLAPADTTIPQARTVQLEAHVVDTAGEPIPGLLPSFTSSDTLIARVTPTGLVTSVGPIGFVIITARLAIFQDFARITIRDSNVVQRLPLSGAPFGVAISPGGVIYVTRPSTNAVSRLDLDQEAFTASVAVGSIPTRVTFNATGTTAYVSNQGSRNVGVIDVVSNTQTTVIPTTGDPAPVALSTDGATLFVTTNADRLYRISLATGAVTHSLSLPATSHHLVVHPGGNLLYVATREGSSVLEVNAHTLAMTRTFALGGRTNAMVLSPDNERLYVANDALSRIHVITLSTGVVTDSIALTGGAFGLGLGPDGSRLYASLTFDGKVEVIDRSSGRIVQTVETGGWPRTLVADAARRLVVVPNEFGWVDLLR